MTASSTTQLPRTSRLPEGRLAYSVEEVRRALGIGRSTIHDLMAMGRIRSVKAGRRTLIPAAAVEAYLAGE
jgi:excisionase family DNA binding protein